MILVGKAAATDEACVLRRVLHAMAAAFVEGGAIIAEEDALEATEQEAMANSGEEASSLASANPAALLAAALALGLLLALVYFAFWRPSVRRRPRRAVLLLGPSGAGKTSLLFRSGSLARVLLAAHLAHFGLFFGSLPCGRIDHSLRVTTRALGGARVARRGQQSRACHNSWPPEYCLRHVMRPAPRAARFGLYAAIDLWCARQDGNNTHKP